MAAKHYAMVIDLKRCIGCHTCAVGCKSENNLPDGIWWNRTLTIGGSEMDTPTGIFPNVEMQYLTLACQHCDDPACVKVCPVGATSKDPETGIVLQDYDRCIGCRYCMVACPYNGVRQFNWAEPKFATGFPTGSGLQHQKDVVEKCTFCGPRLVQGLLPFCVEVCPARARHFGDLNDPQSEVSQLLRQRSHFQLLAEKGTDPSVYFLS